MPAIHISGRQFISIILLLFLMLLGFMQRIDPLYQWEITPHKHLVNGEPMLANLDGYYYLNIAREIQEGTYSTVETHRAWPDTFTRSVIPPLPALITVGIAKLTGLSLNWAGAFLPCFLGVLIGIPIFFLGLRWGGAIMALTAVALSLFSTIYASRTCLGVLDTDCLNVTLVLACACWFLLFCKAEQVRQRYTYLFAGLLTYTLLLWWWDQTPTAATVLGLSPLGLSLLFYYRPPKKEGLLFWGSTACLALAILIWMDFSPVFTIYHKIIDQLSYISKQDTGLYPNIGITIGEQMKMPLSELVRTTTLYLPVLPLACCGLGWLLWSKKESWILLPCVIVGSFSVLFALRFAIFATPMLALGLGFLISEIHRRWDRWYIFATSASLGILFIAFQLFDRGTMRESIFSSPVIEAMQNLQEITPSDAIIWSWWDQGHPLVYWANRHTINDGMVHSGERTHATAVPLSAANDRLAANYMQFYVVNGLKGIHDFYKQAEQQGLNGRVTLFTILKAGPQEAEQLYPTLPSSIVKSWIAFLFPRNPPPVYLFLDELTAKTTSWIRWFGHWDIHTQSAPRELPVISFNSRFNIEGWSLDNLGLPINVEGGISLDPEQRLLSLSEFSPHPIKLHSITVNTGTESYTTPVDKVCEDPITIELTQKRELSARKTQTGRYALDIFLTMDKALLQDQQLADTLVHRLFRRRNQYDPRYIKPIDIDHPQYQIWQVQGDQL